MRQDGETANPWLNAVLLRPHIRMNVVIEIIHTHIYIYIYIYIYIHIHIYIYTHTHTHILPQTIACHGQRKSLLVMPGILSQHSISQCAGLESESGALGPTA